MGFMSKDFFSIQDSHLEYLGFIWQLVIKSKSHVTLYKRSILSMYNILQELVT